MKKTYFWIVRSHDARECGSRHKSECRHAVHLTDDRRSWRYASDLAPPTEFTTRGGAELAAAMAGLTDPDTFVISFEEDREASHLTEIGF